jgi:hypothetical protein
MQETGWGDGRAIMPRGGAYQEDKVAELLRIEHACARISGVARMVKLVDTADLKSAASNGVPVRFRLRAPRITRVFR